ncbi:MAG: phosphoglycerate dehydrogenase [Lachnospiraceae bacterium]|nr:phosphoglycerate dehydrogenase [Lachnospiraceae bacterium]
MFNILTYNKISEAGLRKLDPSKYSVAPQMEDPDAIMVRSDLLLDMQFGPSLKAIARVGAGFNNIPVERCTASGICVFNTPGGNANAVKELVVCGMIMACRNVEKASKWVKELPGEESKYGGLVEKGKEKFCGPEIMGKKIGVIGLGQVGSRVAHACRSLGMEVIGYDPYLTHLRVLELKEDVRIVEKLDEIYSECDFITVHTPLNDETRGMIGCEAIASMKDGVYLLNYARGPIVDNDAVCDALEAGKIAAFATDFPTEREMKMENVVCTPHLASGSPEAEENCAVMAVRQTRDYLENGNISNSVNFPDVSFARADGDRITVLHENKIGMLGQITEIAASKGLNIENLVNKAKEQVAYTILDFNDSVPDSICDELKKIDGVIMVRHIQ